MERNGIPECDAVINLAGENAFIPFRRYKEYCVQNVIYYASKCICSYNLVAIYCEMLVWLSVCHNWNLTHFEILEFLP